MASNLDLHATCLANVYRTNKLQKASHGFKEATVNIPGSSNRPWILNTL